MEERFFVVEDCADGTLECPEWFTTAEEADKRAKQDAKGLRSEDHEMIVCEVLAKYPKPKKEAAK